MLLRSRLDINLKDFFVPRDAFYKIEETLVGKGIFVQKKDALNKDGIHPLLHITTAPHIPAYGSTADAPDEYLQMYDDSFSLSTKHFCQEIVSAFGGEYLRARTESYVKRIMRINASFGFPGRVGRIYCQHWEWKNCPVA